MQAFFFIVRGHRLYPAAALLAPVPIAQRIGIAHLYFGCIALQNFSDDLKQGRKTK